jgi:hypothetical protein
MFGDFPLNALAFCYGPLAVMIIGFIAFAVLSDAHSRRTYLRVMDPRPEDEQDDVKIQVDDKLGKTIETPSSGRITFKAADDDRAIEDKTNQS